ncbi:MAG: hypothetical protein CW338_05455 [Clostridiales bacterium]|nr:hypothetical protein [Clostridiales bacterium]
MRGSPGWRTARNTGCCDFSGLCDIAFPRIRLAIGRYPEAEKILTDMIGKIGSPRIVVVESGCTGTFPLLLKALDDRVDMKMYTAYPYLLEACGDRIYSARYEENRLFETMYSQDLYFIFSGLRDGRFYVKKCLDAGVERNAFAEVKAMLTE